MTPAVEVARSYLAALGGDDPDEVACHVTEAFVNEHQSELGSGCTGRETYRQRLSGFMASFPNRSYTVVDAVAGGGGIEGVEAAAGGGDADNAEPVHRVAVLYRFGADVDGHRIDIPGVMWFEVSNGLIMRRIDTWDSLTFFRQTGQQPPSRPAEGTSE